MIRKKGEWDNLMLMHYKKMNLWKNKIKKPKKVLLLLNYSSIKRILLFHGLYYYFEKRFNGQLNHDAHVIRPKTTLGLWQGSNVFGLIHGVSIYRHTKAASFLIIEMISLFNGEYLTLPLPLEEIDLFKNTRGHQVPGRSIQLTSFTRCQINITRL